MRVIAESDIDNITIKIEKSETGKNELKAAASFSNAQLILDDPAYPRRAYLFQELNGTGVKVCTNVGELESSSLKLGELGAFQQISWLISSTQIDSYYFNTAEKSILESLPPLPDIPYEDSYNATKFNIEPNKLGEEVEVEIAANIAGSYSAEFSSGLAKLRIVDDLTGDIVLETPNVDGNNVTDISSLYPITSSDGGITLHLEEDGYDRYSIRSYVITGTFDKDKTYRLETSKDFSFSLSFRQISPGEFGVFNILEYGRTLIIHRQPESRQANTMPYTVPEVLPERIYDLNYAFAFAIPENIKDVEGWDTSKVRLMNNLFLAENGSYHTEEELAILADLDLSQWCVSQIPYSPSKFWQLGTIKAIPVWGTCPRGEDNK